MAFVPFGVVKFGDALQMATTYQVVIMKTIPGKNPACMHGEYISKLGEDNGSPQEHREAVGTPRAEPKFSRNPFLR
jgi:hypothetical protein